MREQIAVLLLIVFGYIFIRSIPLKKNFGNYIIIFTVFLLLETLLFGIENSVVFDRLFFLQLATFIVFGISYLQFGNFLYIFFEKDEDGENDERCEEKDQLKKYFIMFMYIFVSLTYNLFFYHFHEIFVKK